MKSARLAALVLAVYWIGLFIGTHMPGQPGRPLNHLDKVVHFSAFLLLAGLLAWVVSRSQKLTWQGWGLLWGALALYGVVDELLQMFVPHRSCDPWDWLADVTGAACGLAICAAWNRTKPHTNE